MIIPLSLAHKDTAIASHTRTHILQLFPTIINNTFEKLAEFQNDEEGCLMCVRNFKYKVIKFQM